MKTIKYLLLGFVLIFGISACELPDNVNPKEASEVPAETLFTNAMLACFNQVDHVSVNRNITRLMVQYWQETTYFDESRYLFQDRKIPDEYADRMYRWSLIDFEEAKSILTSPEYGGDPDERDNMVNIIEICEVYAWHVIVDAFGNMPYSQALQGSGNSAPAYDDAATIYTDIISRLTTALGNLNTGAGSFGSADVFFNGDVASWKKFGASLLLRLGMRLADANATASTSAVANALQYGVIGSQAESGMVNYTGVVPHVNAIYDAFVVDNRKDYLPTNTIIDMMKSMNDPRLPLWFTQYDGDYVGAVAGLDGAQSYNNFSNFSAPFFEATFPAIIIDYVEVQFLLAEAAQRGGYGVSGSAADYYNTAITESIVYWGGSTDDAAAFLAANPYDAANWKESIGTQKWLALYNRGIEAWAEWRRLDFPILNVPEGMTYDMIPLRMPYPYDEVAQNGENYYNAVEAMGISQPETENYNVPLFWDKF
ncbi:MAG: SusD/RagB family nutrient-binding outer membrane lipoprotein [Bacteroidales bacterium]|nr:SusD/RagB family nutrient-binding outer membrane lipoprotein [Bacteroidales bacterium]MCF8403308.1 SusD/RagB family nutrient-binding outer membrane lipoprotein [Bacteroidales bacterium]